jgi:hypothetical protein
LIGGLKSGTPWRKLSEPKKSEIRLLDKTGARHVPRVAETLLELEGMATDL